MAALRPVLSVMLALAVVASSVTMAVARGNSSQLHEVVICSGYGVVTISVDADGNPAGPVHACPDCIASVAVIDVDETSLPGFARIVLSRHFIPAISTPRARMVHSFRARAPPRTV